MAVRVLLVEDVADMRLLLRVTLERLGGYEVVAEAANGLEALDLAEAHQPDAIVLDLGLPHLAGTELVRRLRERTGAKIVVFTGSEEEVDDYLGHVEGFVGKAGGPNALVALLRDLEFGTDRNAAMPLAMAVGSPAIARSFVADRCRAWGCERIVDEALVVVSELVTNAVVHAESHPHLVLSHGDDVLRIVVSDVSKASPDLRDPDEGSEHGRGLLLVAAFSQAWGVEDTPSGKRVWAQLPCGERTDLVSP